MIRLLLPLLVVAFFVLQSFGAPAESTNTVQPTPVSLGEFLYTVPLKKQITLDDAQLRWYHEYFEPRVNDSVFEPLLQQIKNKKTDVFRPEYPFTQKMDRQSARDLFAWQDSVEIEDPNNLGTYMVIAVNSEIHADKIASITFHEQWSYDASTLTLTKTVKGIIPNVHTVEDNVVPTVYIPINDKPSIKANVAVHGITSDFVTDGSSHSPSDFIERTCSDSGISGNQSKVSQRLLNDFVMHSQVKGSMLYEPVYPFVQLIGKKEKAERVANLPSANSLLFSEDWEVNAQEQVFRKVVRGVVPMIEKEIKSEETFQSAWHYEPTVYIPMNGIVPVSAAPQVCVVDRIAYYVPYKDPEGVDRSWMRFADTMQLDSMAFDIREHVKRMEIASYGQSDRTPFCDPFDTPCSQLADTEVRQRFFQTDTVMEEYYEEPFFKNVVVEHEIDHNLTSGYKFFESWVMNFANQSFSKQTKYIGITRMVLDNWGEMKAFGYMPFYYKNPGTSGGEAKTAKYQYRADVISGCLLNRNEFDYDEDGMGNRILMYYDEWENNIPPSKRYAFIQPIIDLVRAGKMKAYPSFNDQSAMTPTAFNLRLNEVAKTSNVSLTANMEYALLNQVYFHEKWFYNRVTGQIYKEVVAITFTHREKDVYNAEKDEVKPNVQQVFTIRLNPAQ